MQKPEKSRLPRWNVWKALFDIRPASSVSDERFRRLPAFLDLRVLRQFPAGSRRTGAASRPPIRLRILRVPSLAKLAAVAGVILMTGALFQGSRMAVSAIESRAAQIRNVGDSVVQRADKGLSLLGEAEFAASRDEFRSAGEELARFEKIVGPALFVTRLTAMVRPDNEYVKTALMLQDAKSAFFSAGRIGDLAAELIRRAPRALFEGDPEFLQLIESARVEFENLESLVGAIESNRNAFAASLAGTWFSKLPEMKLALREGAASLDALDKILGAQKPMTVLLLFQNPAEIRATGGFTGSYGILRFERGKIAEFRVDDIYNPDGQLENKILPPKPLLRVTPVWGARDANWFFDFGLSSEKVAGFLGETTGISFDAVVAVNPVTVAELTDLVGPIAMPEYGKVITGDNLWEEMQFQTRAGQDRAAGQPKKFLTIFGPRLLEKFAGFDAANAPALVDIFRRALAAKNAQMWTADPELEAFIESRDWDGKVSAVGSEEDYLAVVLANIGGAKADYVMRTTYSLETSIEPSGDILNTLRITRTHEGDREKYSWWNAENVTYLRVFVPKGSVLLDVTGASPEPRLITVKDRDAYTLDPDVATTIGAGVRLDQERADIFEESGKTVFGVWQVIRPGESRTITLEWQLPFNAGFGPPHYSLLFEAQSGVDGVFQHSIELPRGSRITDIQPDAGDPAATLGNRFSWIGDALAKSVRHALSFEFQ